MIVCFIDMSGSGKRNFLQLYIIISCFKRHGELPGPLTQEQVKQDGAHCILHPLLKHVVLLSLSDK
jgi:hypothetical protein